MTYSQQTWQDGNPAYPTSAARMAHIEAGIAGVETEVIGTDGKIGGPGSVGLSGILLGATGPGGVVGANTSTAQDITSFNFAAWYGLVNQAVLVTLGAPTNSSVQFPLFLVEDNVGGHSITIQGDTGVSINWVNGTLNAKTNAGDVNTVVFYSTADATGWLAYVITTAASNLSDLTDFATSRYNLGIGLLGPAKAGSSTNLTLSGTQTVDGVSLGVGDTCFAFGQTTASQNGPWVVQASTWTRPNDYPAGGVVPLGRMIRVTGGTSNSGLYGTSGTTSITVGTTSTTWVKLGPSAGGGGGGFTPSTTVINATNATWPIPSGAATLKITCIGGGGGGAGAGTNSAAAAQAGGAAGASGAVTQAIVSVGSNTTLNVNLPTTGGGGGTGGASGGNAGTSGSGGSTASVTGTGISVSALGGGGGVRSPASSTATQMGGMPGAASFVGGGSTLNPQGPGVGGANVAAGAGPSTGGAPMGYSGGGGSGGVSSSTTNGGNGGNAGTANAGGSSASGTTASANGGNGANATAVGAGGGGGGGAPSGGTGGNGGSGGPPQVIIEVVG